MGHSPAQHHCVGGCMQVFLQARGGCVKKKEGQHGGRKKHDSIY